MFTALFFKLAKGADFALHLQGFQEPVFNCDNIADPSLEESASITYAVDRDKKARDRSPAVPV